MNFLSHAYLSFGYEELIVGNFIADKVKGKKYLDYPTKIQKGILLHRQIDYFTDKHPLVFKMTQLISRNHGHYAPIINDIFMDHFLAKNWHDYHNQDLGTFVSKVLCILEKYKTYIPETLQNFIIYVQKTNRLVEYQYLNSIQKTLLEVAHKIVNYPPLERAMDDLQLHYVELEQFFKEFFVQIIAFCKLWISQNFLNLLTEN